MPEPDAPLGVDSALDRARVGRPPAGVIRRILAEQKELVEHCLALAVELPDPAGRERARSEALALARELQQLEPPMDEVGSDRLDAIVAKLFRLDTRVALLHEALRTATLRTTAVEAD